MDLEELLRCPRCRHPLRRPLLPAPACGAPTCEYSRVGFPVSNGQPVLIDFTRSVFERGSFTERAVSVIPRDPQGRSLRSRLRRLTMGDNPVAPIKVQEFLAHTKARAMRPVVLVVGGGERGAGTDALYMDDDLQLVGTDVYASPLTRVVLDGHRLPFADGAFDAVWVQAVLHHVLEPHVVVEEIHRVLKPEGVVYAETAFMQQLTEEAYDFTRFTPSGHRWLFRRFTELDAGIVKGPGTSAVWALRYLMRSVGASNQLATALSLPLFFLRYLDRLASPAGAAAAASAIYFMGKKTEQALRPGDIVAYHRRFGGSPSRS